MNDSRLYYVTVSGNPEELGFNYGYKLRAQIQKFVEQRLRCAQVYMWEHGVRDTEGFYAAGKRSLAVYKEWDHDGYREHIAIAEGARVDAVALYACSNMTDIRDVLLYQDHAQTTLNTDDEGCTALILPKNLSADNMIIGAQTWDLNPGDVDYIVAVHRIPDEGPETWSVTCSGCLTLMGMNEYGLSIGTTNLKASVVQDGIPYLALLHRAIRCKDHYEAVDIIEQAPRAGAHTYWIADQSDATYLETNATHSVHRNLDTEALCHTNHCVATSIQSDETDAPIESSLKRLDKIHQLSALGNHTVDSIRDIFANRDDDVHSINRYPEDQQGTTTNSCMICIPEKREIWACKGPADRGQWRQLLFKTHGSP